MPELPEVETIRLGLEKYLVGHRIEKIEIRLPKILQGDALQAQGAKVKDIRRFGKALVIDLDNDVSIVAHVKMTGQFLYIGPNRPTSAKISEKFVGKLPGKHTHVIFKLDNGATLFYNDIRQFGWIKICHTSEVEQLTFVKGLGLELPVTNSSRAILSFEDFQKILTGNTKIKIILMDQKKIGGIGNIYANDALWLAGINPIRISKSLSGEEVEKLYKALIKVLKDGLKYGGASETNFVNALGEEGSYQKHFLVYGQVGKPCKNCDEVIKRTVIAGRGTFFCPNCQK